MEGCPILTNRLQWNGIQSIGIPLVKCMPLWGLKYFRPFYLSTGVLGTIGTNGISFIPLVSHWWNASHYGDLEYFRRLQADWGWILLVHWYDWYQWNNIYSIGILLVKSIPLWDISVGFRLSGSALYLSIGLIGTIGINGITFIPLVFYWWNASHYGWLRIFPMASGWLRVHSTCPLVRLVRLVPMK